jgi:hypothetical protein
MSDIFLNIISLTKKLRDIISIISYDKEKFYENDLFLVFYFSLFINKENYNDLFENFQINEFKTKIENFIIGHKNKILFLITLIQKAISQKQNEFLKKFSFLLKYKGLSNTGLDIGNQLGFLVSQSTLLRFEQELIKKHDEKLEKIDNDENIIFVGWMDNFNRLFKKNNFSIKGKIHIWNLNLPGKNEVFTTSNITAFGGNLFKDLK